MMDNNIYISEYLDFDTEIGWFRLSDKAQETLYREKEVICSYSGCVEWGHLFFCELLNLYSGSSPFNYALGTIDFNAEIERLYEEGHKQEVIDWVNREKDKVWFVKAATMMYRIINDVPKQGK